MKLLSSGIVQLLLFFVCSFLEVNARTIDVPQDYASIAEAVAASEDDDVIIIHPGSYTAKGILIDKRITVTSEWYLTGDEDIIDQTVINADKATLFFIRANDVEISGLRFEDGDDTFDIEARVVIKYCHFARHNDPVSMEGNGGGYVGYCRFTENTASEFDDAIDCDIGENGPNEGYDIEIEHNFIDGTDDDGIEIRLFTFDNPIRYNIHDNIIMNTDGAGIQIISYDVYTGKSFHIHRNVFVNCKTGLGCMEGVNTSENLQGAEFMDERVLFHNNTMINNQMGATGANHVIALNNIVMGGTIGGFNNFNSANSVVDYNLFFNNNDQDLAEIEMGVDPGQNLMDMDPMVNVKSFELEDGSIGIDAGVENYLWKGDTVLSIGSDEFKGMAPDLGAREFDESILAVRSKIGMPNFVLIPPYPNPFSNKTHISFKLAARGHVQLKLYDITGSEVNILVDDFLRAGTHSYTWTPHSLEYVDPGEGLYFVRLTIGAFQETVKLIWLGHK